MVGGPFGRVCREGGPEYGRVPLMATMSELISQGVTRMRLPSWNQHAYAEPRPAGPWADVYDVMAGIGGGDPVPVLIGECDRDSRWEQVPR